MVVIIGYPDKEKGRNETNSVVRYLQSISPEAFTRMNRNKTDSKRSKREKYNLLKPTSLVKCT